MILKDLWNDIHQIQYQMGKQLNDATGYFEGFGDFPSTRIYTSADQLIVMAQVPSLNQDELHLTITDDILSISGEIKKISAENGGEFKVLRRERKTGKFQKTIELPYPVDGDRSEAVLKNGILTITFTLKEDAKARQISIKPSPL